MHRFIIASGWKSTVQVIEASSLLEAQLVATNKSLQDGVDADLVTEFSWAEPYSDDVAFDVGIYPGSPEREFEYDIGC